MQISFHCVAGIVPFADFRFSILTDQSPPTYASRNPIAYEVTARWLKGNVIANEWLYINMSNCIWFSKTAGCKGLKTL